MNYLLLLLALLVPLAPYPEWAYSACGELAYIRIDYVNPPPEVLPFDESNPGLLFINHNPFVDTVQLPYYWKDTIGGVDTYHFAGYYNRPEGAWTLSALIYIGTGGSAWAYPTEYAPCGGGIWLPEIKVER